VLERAPSAHLASVLDIPDKRRQRSKVTGERGYLDFEIRSWIDLRVVGPLVYARHPPLRSFARAGLSTTARCRHGYPAMTHPRCAGLGPLSRTMPPSNLRPRTETTSSPFEGRLPGSIGTRNARGRGQGKLLIPQARSWLTGFGAPLLAQVLFR